MNPSRLVVDEHVAERRLVLHGDVDSHTTDLLSSHLDALGTADGDVTLDLTDVAFIDSSGLRVVVSAHQASAEAGHRLVLVAPSSAVQRLLEITGLQEHLNII